jgi:hypothetical protein
MRKWFSCRNSLRALSRHLATCVDRRLWWEAITRNVVADFYSARLLIQIQLRNALSFFLSFFRPSSETDAKTTLKGRGGFYNPFYYHRTRSFARGMDEGVISWLIQDATHSSLS